MEKVVLLLYPLRSHKSLHIQSSIVLLTQCLVMSQSRAMFIFFSGAKLLLNFNTSRSLWTPCRVTIKMSVVISAWKNAVGIRSCHISQSSWNTDDISSYPTLECTLFLDNSLKTLSYQPSEWRLVFTDTHLVSVGFTHRSNFDHLVPSTGLILYSNRSDTAEFYRSLEHLLQNNMPCKDGNILVIMEVSPLRFEN